MLRVAGQSATRNAATQHYAELATTSVGLQQIAVKNILTASKVWRSAVLEVNKLLGSWGTLVKNITNFTIYVRMRQPATYRLQGL